jgi:hypothetical protein
MILGSTHYPGRHLASGSTGAARARAFARAGGGRAGAQPVADNQEITSCAPTMP